MRIITLLTIFLLTSCSTVTYRYSSKLLTKEGESKGFDFEKSYDVGSLRYFCGVTAIFYGGYCWKYYSKPSIETRKAILSDSKKELNRLLKNKEYVIVQDRITRLSFSSIRTRSALIETEHLKGFLEEDKLKADIEEYNILRKNALMIYLRSGGSGLAYNRQLTDRIAFHTTYVKHRNRSGRVDDYRDEVKSAHDYGVGYRYLLNGRFDKNSFFIYNNYIYSKRHTYSPYEDSIDEIERPKNGEAFYTELGVGVRFEIFKSMHFDLGLEKSVELKNQDGGRNNSNGIIGAIGFLY